MSEKKNKDKKNKDCKTAAKLQWKSENFVVRFS